MSRVHISTHDICFFFFVFFFLFFFCDTVSPYNMKNKEALAIKHIKPGHDKPTSKFQSVRFPVSILRKSISGRHRPVRVADGPMTARCRFT